MQRQTPTGIIVVAADEPTPPAPPPPPGPYWREDESDPSDPSGCFINVRDPAGWWKATVRSDGCIHLYRYLNEPMDRAGRSDDCDCYLHICDIDDAITRLTALRDEARRRLGPDWR